MNDLTTNPEGFRLKWTLKKKIGGLTGLLLGMLGVGTVFSSLKIMGIGGEIAEIADAQVPLTEALVAIEKYQLEQHVLLERLLGGVARDAGIVEDRAKVLDRFDEYGKLINQTIKKGREIAGQTGGGGKKEYAKIDASLVRLEKERKDFEAHARQLIRTAAVGKTRGLAEQVELLEREARDVDQLAEAELENLEELLNRSSASARDHEISALGGNAFLGALSLLLGLGLSFFLVRDLGRAIAAVGARARGIAQGDLRGESLQLDRTDELGRLADTFNRMVVGLREIVEQNRGGTENLNSASAEILASTQQQAASTKEQASAVHQTTATMEQVRQSGQQIAERAKQVAAEAEATSAITHTGLESVREAVRTMESIREQVEEVAENIVALSEKNQAVGDIIATVNDIAEQSKLLALNAAIEAAAAGEQGGRFSVVANEMKNLADQAKDSTQQVRSILGEIQKGINSAVMQTEEAVKRVESGKRKTDGAEGTIRQMADTTQKSVQAFQQIVAATGQQHIGFEQVTQALQNIRQATEQTAAGTSQLEKAVANLNALAQQLNKSVARYELN